MGRPRNWSDTAEDYILAALRVSESVLLKWIVSIVALLLVGFGGLLAYLSIAFAEPKGLALDGWTTGLYIPAEIRETPQVEICRPLEVSRYWEECGGICGGTYVLTYPSTASIEQVRETVGQYGAQFPQYTVSIKAAPGEEGGGCTEFLIEYYQDNRSDS